MDLPTLLSRLPERWQWTLHNIVAHPIAEILHQFGLQQWSKRVYDGTISATNEVSP